MDRRNIPEIAEVIGALATEVDNEIIILEDFAELNPDLTSLPNISPDDATLLE
jgi:hypothetical protein